MRNIAPTRYPARERKPDRHLGRKSPRTRGLAQAARGAGQRTQ